MKKTLAAAAALLTISSSAFAALPPGVFTSQKPAGPASRPPVSTHRVHVSSYQPMNTVTNRVHITSSQPVHAGSQRMHTPTGNRVRMTPTHGELGPVGGRMSSTARVSQHGGSASVHVGPPPGPPAGTRYDRNYVRPSLPTHIYYYPVPPPPPPRWRYAGYYGRPYGYSSIWWGVPVAYYGYPYGVFYGRYYTRPGIRVSVRI